jgi:hypothetical protein
LRGWFVLEATLKRDEGGRSISAGTLSLKKGRHRWMFDDFSWLMTSMCHTAFQQKVVMKKTLRTLVIFKQESMFCMGFSEDKGQGDMARKL